MKSVSAPLAPHFKLNTTLSPTIIEEHEHMTYVSYSSMVGSFICALVCTGPNLSQVISMVSKYMHDPDRGHWEAVKWILQCIKVTVDIGLVFEKDFTCKQERIRCVDFDYTGDLDKHQFTTGFVFILAQTPLCWRYILHSTVALSTMKAEYMAMMEAIKKAIYLQGLP